MKIPKSLFSGRALVRMASGRGPSRSKMYARDLEGECSSTKRGSPPSSVLLAASLAICGGVSTLWAYHTAVIQDDILKQRRVPVRNPCEVDAYGGGVSPAAGHASSCAERRVLAHECSTPYAIVASWTCDRSAPAPPTARACSTAAPQSSEDALSRGSGGGRRRRDGATVAAHPRGAAPRSLLASQGTTRAVLSKALPG